MSATPTAASPVSDAAAPTVVAAVPASPGTAAASGSHDAAAVKQTRDQILAAHFEQADAEATPPAADKTAVVADKPKQTDESRRKSSEARRAAEAARLEAATKEAATKAVADYVAKLKADPGTLFADVQDEQLLYRLAEARTRQLTPEAQEREALRREIAETRARLDGMQTEAQKREAAVAATNREQVMLRVLESGLDEDGVKIEAKWPLAQRLTKAGVISAHREALAIADKLANGLGRRPTERETATLISIAYDRIEEREAERAKHYSPPEPKGRPPSRTISATTPRGGHVSEQNNGPRVRGRYAAREEILAKLRTKQI